METHAYGDDGHVATRRGKLGGRVVVGRRKTRGEVVGEGEMGEARQARARFTRSMISEAFGTRRDPEGG